MNFHDMGLVENTSELEAIEAVEYYADENGLISSEAELSERFDNEIIPILPDEWFDTRNGGTDYIAINEAFNTWVDMLCKDGDLHPVQYNQYCYVGKYSD